MRSALLLLCLLPGCSFPDPSITDEPFTETAVVVDSSGDVFVDSAVEDATSDIADADVATADTKDAGDTGIPVCETGVDCDCDGDGDKKPGPGCGGADCDDGDSRRNSKVTEYQSYSAATLMHGGDWNCKMGVEREFGNGGFVCSGLLGGTACTSATGYKEATPACGSMATRVTCKEVATICTKNTETAVVVRCK